MLSVNYQTSASLSLAPASNRSSVVFLVIPGGAVVIPGGAVVIPGGAVVIPGGTLCHPERNPLSSRAEPREDKDKAARTLALSLTNFLAAQIITQSIF
jgi:hypothetical protein